ncbi:hypothetical protein FQN50_001750 [Emmonsiellopsis sp. PD_5]|nr:hypothetical protein FQN50_001750 [Emmonsiellopsis sp. PD_5]
MPIPLPPLPPPPDWPSLYHAYGPATDTPSLLASLTPGPSDAWSALWGSICHQGTVYPASFAALPLLASIAAGWAPRQRTEAVLLAAGIIRGLGDGDGDGDDGGEGERVWREYGEWIWVFRELAASCVGCFEGGYGGGEGEGDGEAEAEADFVYLVQAMLVFEGSPGPWGERLEGLAGGEMGEYLVVCPRCEAEVFCGGGGEDGRGFAARMDREMAREWGWGGIWPEEEGGEKEKEEEEEEDIPVVAVEEDELRRRGGVGWRVYEMAVHKGMKKLAGRVLYLCGRAECACGERFVVGEAEEKFWNRY